MTTNVRWINHPYDPACCACIRADFLYIPPLNELEIVLESASVPARTGSIHRSPTLTTWSRINPSQTSDQSRNQSWAQSKSRWPAPCLIRSNRSRPTHWPSMLKIDTKSCEMTEAALLQPPSGVAPGIRLHPETRRNILVTLRYMQRIRKEIQSRKGQEGRWQF